MSPPQDVGGIRRFLGLNNQQAKFLPNLAEITKPLRELLRKGQLWDWGEVQTQSFDRIKRV